MSTPVIHPERASAYARGDLAERMARVAWGLGCLVRDEDAESIGEFLATLDAAEKYALLIVAAGMIPVGSATPDELLAWVTWDEFGAPLPGTRPAAPAPAARDAEADARFYEDCGTSRAYWRHRSAGHPREQVEACGCGQAGRDYYAALYADRRGGHVRSVARKSRTAEREECFAELRRQGDSVVLAAEKLGVSERTASRYEAKLKAGRSRAA